MAKIIYVDDNGNQKVLKEGNYYESDVLFREDYIAMKLWSSDDIKTVMRDNGYSVTPERVDAVVNEGNKWNGLNDCDDSEWDYILQVIEWALGEPDIDKEKVLQRLRKEFDRKIEGTEKKSGCWRVYVENEYTEEGSETEGDIHDDTTWDDFFEWMVDDIQKMDIGELHELHIREIYYAGKDEHWED